MKAAKVIREVALSAKDQFVDRDNAIDAIESCILSGLHCCILGKPGTSKSGLIQYFAQSLGLKYFKTQMNPDLLRDDLVGPIDPAKFINGDGIENGQDWQPLTWLLWMRLAKDQDKPITCYWAQWKNAK